MIEDTNTSLLCYVRASKSSLEKSYRDFRGFLWTLFGRNTVKLAVSGKI
jgi:hypothetical protein